MIDYEKEEIFDKLKTKILKYILYKKRTEQEIRQKFQDEDEFMLEDAIEYLKELNYINDEEYVKKAVNEYIILKDLSIKELTYKLYQKGISKKIVDEFICNNKEKMIEYEIRSARKIIVKKLKNTELEEIKEFLYKKGYMSETIEIAIQEGE